MSTNVQFGMLQNIKTQQIKKNPNLQNLQAQIQSQTDIYTEAKQAYEKAAQGEQGAQAQTFSMPTMSVDELETKMADAQAKLEQLEAAFTKEADKPEDGNMKNQKGEDDKNKIQKKEFGSLMA